MMEYFFSESYSIRIYSNQELGRRSDNPAASLKRVTAWLDARPDVQNWRVSEEFDVMIDMVVSERYHIFHAPEDKTTRVGYLQLQ